MKRRRIVIKYGGHAMASREHIMQFATDVRALTQSGADVVVVHGGGPQIELMLKNLGLTSSFRNGLRLTDDAVMNVIQTVLCGEVNASLSGLFQAVGVRAVGVSGIDGGLLQAIPMLLPSELPHHRTGEVQNVDPRLIETLHAGGYTPIVAPVGAGVDGLSLNVNGDTAAGAIAGALQADLFLLLTDISAVRNARGEDLPILTASEARTMVAAGIASGGMIPKLECALHALAEGAQEVRIVDGRVPHAVLDSNVSGTRILQD